MESFKKYQYRRCITEEGELCEGSLTFENENKETWTLRFHKGFLSNALETQDDGKDVLHPAVEKSDGSHVEFWENGELHRENEPAIIDLNENVEEWYEHGEKREAVSG